MRMITRDAVKIRSRQKKTENMKQIEIKTIEKNLTDEKEGNSERMIDKLKERIDDLMYSNKNRIRLKERIDDLMYSNQNRIR
jgi:hypothetical protein